MKKLLALFAVLAMVIAACGGGDDAGDTTVAGGDTSETTAGGDTSETTAGGDTSETTAGGGDGEQVEMWVWASRDWYTVPDNFEAFMEANPNITVTQDVQGNDDILQQLQRMKDAGQPMPDVINDDTFLMESYIAAGIAGPFDDLMAQWEEEDPEEFANILPIAWEENTVDGSVYGASLTANFDIIYYNLDHMAAAGVDAAGIDSLDGLLEAMRAVKAASPDIIPLTVQALPGQGVTTLKTFLSSAGAPYDGAVPDLTSQGGLYTLNWFITAANEGLMPPEAIAWGEGEARGAFLGKRAAFILDGFTVSGDFALEEGFDYGVVWEAIPAPASQTGAQKDGDQISNARSWFVNADTEHPQEALLIMKEINDSLVDQAINGGVPMRNSKHLADPRLDDLWPFFTPELEEAYIGSASVPAGLNGGEVEGVLEQLFGEIVIGTDKTAEELAAEYQPILDEL